MTILSGLAKDFQWIVEDEDDKIVMIMIRILDDERTGEIDDRLPDNAARISHLN